MKFLGSLGVFFGPAVSCRCFESSWMDADQDRAHEEFGVAHPCCDAQSPAHRIAQEQSRRGEFGSKSGPDELRQRFETIDPFRHELALVPRQVG